MRTTSSRVLRVASTLFALLAVALATSVVGCTDTPTTGAEDTQNQAGQDSNKGDDPDSGDNQTNQGGDNDNQTGQNTANNNQTGQNNDTEPPCQNYECDQVDCPAGEPTTTLTGTVYTPSGELPLPNINVYIPNGQVEPMADGVTCQRCEEMLSGDPLVEATTNYRGEFELENVPVTQNVPLVIQTGKWRRQVEVSTIEQCRENTVAADKTRLPRNRDEGNIPDIVVTSGYYDALECIPYEIGLDDSEFGTFGDDGAVTILNNGGSTGFDSSFGGEDFVYANDWWDEVENFEQQDLFLNSCDGNIGDPDLLEEFVDQGGRAFLTDLQYEWLDTGSTDLRSVATWGGGGPYGDSSATAWVDTSFSDGQTMNQWLDHVDALQSDDSLSLAGVYSQIGSIDPDLTTQWIYAEPSGQQRPQYFDFNTPVTADPDQQCGRVVYSQLHVADGGSATAGGSFPSNCGGDGDLSGQELALVYMLFDLSSCVVPECEPLTCEDIDEDCGVHPDGCGASIDCGLCCSELGEGCDEDADCCDELWCDDETGIYECTGRCRDQGERCTEDSQCCSDSCAIPSGDDEGECISS